MNQLAPLSLSNWQSGPYNRRTFGRVREFVPTARVKASNQPPALPDSKTAFDPSIRVVDQGIDLGSVEEVLLETFTDGLLVLSEGQLVAEVYPGDLEADRNHALFSVSKSLVGTVCGILAAQGKLTVNDLVTDHAPELATSGYHGARIRDLLDMRSGIKFSEEYEDLTAEVRRIDQAVGWLPRTDDHAPEYLYDYLPQLKAAREHGGHFEYRSCETDVLGWICERASGERMPELLSRLLWSRIAEHDMDAGVDWAGTVFFDGGLCATARDMARFGDLICRGGRLGNEQIIPLDWIEDTLVGGPDSREAFAAGPEAAELPGWMYRNKFWVPYADRRVLLCMGIHDQLVYIDLDHHAVVVKFSSQPSALDAALHAKSIAVAEACIRAID